MPTPPITPLPNAEPRILVAGDSWKWLRDLPQYSAADGWALNYSLRGPAKLDFAAIQDPANLHGFSIYVPPATTAPLAPGTYAWVAYVTYGAPVTDRYEVNRGTLEIRANIQAQPVGFDGRSHVKKVLDSVMAVIEGTASKEQAEYQIHGRMLKRRTVDELLKLKHRYEFLYRKEQIKAGTYDGPNNAVRVRFGRTAGSVNAKVNAINDPFNV